MQATIGASGPAEERRRTGSAPAQPVDDGFAELFGPGLEVSAALLSGFDVDGASLRRWLRDGSLQRTRRKSMHRTTAATLELVRAAYARSIAR